MQRDGLAFLDKITHQRYWALESGEYVGTKRKLGERLEDKGFRRSRATGGARKYMGICCMREVVEASKSQPFDF